MWIPIAVLVLQDLGRWDWYWPLALAANAACIAIPVAGYVAWSYARCGENGLKSYEGHPERSQ